MSRTAPPADTAAVAQLTQPRPARTGTRGRGWPPAATPPPEPPHEPRHHPALVLPAEVAVLLGFGISKVKMKIATGELRSIKDGKYRRALSMPDTDG
ncbi:hypothetical protein AB0H57_17420 [Micromonospora sp. NPDC050686]|uniref:hypothetical protein n=1 Tax=Micromonospora sp. NPDC050686 TaxID=3154631 RepID=UPI00340CA110